MSNIVLNAKQQKALDFVKSGKNLLLTGAAGVGKSTCIESIISYAKENNINISTTASTGMAAYLINGRTIHSTLGIGLARDPAEELAKKVNKKYHIASNIKKLNILIIDEISMIDNELFTKISDFLSVIRKNSKPFGGIQIILSGDFTQLPPVNNTFCFLSPIWPVAKFKTVVLDINIRQGGDLLFQNILSELRWGRCSDETLHILEQLKNTKFENDVKPTKLYSLNVNVDHINYTEYNKLLQDGAEKQTYITSYSDSSSTSTNSSKLWAASIKIPSEIELCIGAQIIVKYNISSTEDSEYIVNGTRGVIVALHEQSVDIKLVNESIVNISYVTLECADNKKLSVSFMPLKLAYALTIHNSQGCTLDAVEIDLGDSIFEYHMAYTGLSRCKSLSSVKIIDVKAKSFRTHPLIKQFYKQ